MTPALNLLRREWRSGEPIREPTREPTCEPTQLAGGERQQVALARVFASSAKVLFADEPTGKLDTATGTAVGDLLFELNREFGTTLVKHDLNLAGRCERRIEIHSGRLTSAPAK